MLKQNVRQMIKGGFTYQEIMDDLGASRGEINCVSFDIRRETLRPGARGESSPKLFWRSRETKTGRIVSESVVIENVVWKNLGLMSMSEAITILSDNFPFPKYRPRKYLSFFPMMNREYVKDEILSIEIDLPVLLHKFYQTPVTEREFYHGREVRLYGDILVIGEGKVCVEADRELIELYAPILMEKKVNPWNVMLTPLEKTLALSWEKPAPDPLPADIMFIVYSYVPSSRPPVYCQFLCQIGYAPPDYYEAELAREWIRKKQIRAEKRTGPREYWSEEMESDYLMNMSNTAL